MTRHKAKGYIVTEGYSPLTGDRKIIQIEQVFYWKGVGYRDINGNVHVPENTLGGELFNTWDDAIRKRDALAANH